MLYHNYMEKLLGSIVKVKIARTLCRIPQKTWTSRELAKFIGISNMSVLRTLKDFMEMNLIGLSRAGNSHIISVKKSSFAFTEILKPLFDLEKSALESLEYDLKGMFPPKYIILYALFGSLVAKEEKPNSDIDLLVVTDHPDQVENLLAEKQWEISGKYGNIISPFIMTRKEFKEKQDSPFLKEAKKSHIILQGRWI